VQLTELNMEKGKLADSLPQGLNHRLNLAVFSAQETPALPLYYTVKPCFFQDNFFQSMGILYKNRQKSCHLA